MITLSVEEQALLLCPKKNIGVPPLEGTVLEVETDFPCPESSKWNYYIFSNEHGSHVLQRSSRIPQRQQGVHRRQDNLAKIQSLWQRLAISEWFRIVIHFYFLKRVIVPELKEALDSVEWGRRHGRSCQRSLHFQHLFVFWQRKKRCCPTKYHWMSKSDKVHHHHYNHHHHNKQIHHFSPNYCRHNEGDPMATCHQNQFHPPRPD